MFNPIVESPANDDIASPTTAYSVPGLAIKVSHKRKKPKLRASALFLDSVGSPVSAPAILPQVEKKKRCVLFPNYLIYLPVLFD